MNFGSCKYIYLPYVKDPDYTLLRVCSNYCVDNNLYEEILATNLQN